VNPERILAAARSVLGKPRRSYPCPPLWDGKAATRIVPILCEHLEKMAHGKVET
jgi:hypothetical protein